MDAQRLNVGVQLSDEALDAIAERAAALVLERLAGETSSSASEWLTVKEAAELLRCDPQRIFDLRSAGRLTRYREGGRALVARAELVRLVVDDDAPAGRVRHAA